MVHSSSRNSPMTGSAENGRRGAEFEEAVSSPGCTVDANNSCVCNCKDAGRVPLNQDEFYEVCQYSPSQKKSGRQISGSSCSSVRIQRYLKKLLPVFGWLPKYNVRRDCMVDIIAGVTLAVVQIPQAMAFAMLSTASPVLGLYATFFASAVYFCLGTSKFSSLGMAGVTALVVGEAINEQLNNLQQNSALNETLGDEVLFGTNHTVIDVDVFKTEIATTMAFIVGIFQATMGLLNLGSLSILFSDVMMRACTMAAVTQMIISQLPHLLGIQIHRQAGPLSSVYNIIDISNEIHNTNYATLITSIASFIFLIAINEGINSRYRNKLKIPIPTEIILIAIGTAMSYYGNLHVDFSVKVLNFIPTGLPSPTPPRFDLIPSLMVHSITVTVLTFTIIMSQAKVLSSKYDCFPDISQELFANGVANIVGSFFSSLPCSFAFVRCMLLIHLKARSLLCSIVCASVMLLALLYLAPIFEPLPHCVLAAVLVFTLAEILLDLNLIQKTWKSVKTDSIVIVFSYLSVFLLDLQFGIAIGVGVSMLMVVFKSMRVKISTLGLIRGRDLYLDVKIFKKAEEIDNIKIFHLGGSLFFGTKEALKSKIEKEVVRVEQKKCLHNEKQDSSNTINSNQLQSNGVKTTVIVEEWTPSQIKFVILDLAAVTFIDTSALRTIVLIQEQLENVAIQLYLTTCSSNILRTFQKSEINNKVEGLFYPTIHDAVLAAKLKMKTTKGVTTANSKMAAVEAYDNLSFVDLHT